MHSCWSCQKSVEANNFARLDSCSHCGRDTHVCKNCLHYDRSAYNECRESSADRVVDKEKSNYCDFFKPKGTSAAGVGFDPAAKAKAAAEALFKPKP